MVSIIVPLYNSYAYIGRCIDSVIKQTYTNWELIVVNDGSTDRSEEIVRQYVADPRIKLYSRENSGVSSSRNFGVAKAQGTYVFFLDSDDWLSDDACETLVNVMTKENADCTICGFSQTHGNIWAPEFNRIYVSPEDLKQDFDYWLNTELLSSSVNKLYKRNLLKTTFPEHMSFGEDLFFSLRYLAQCNTVVFITEALYNHEVFNQNSITHSFKTSRFEDLEQMQDCILNFAENVTSDTNKKYCNDAITLVKSLFRQTNISSREKISLLQRWLKKSYFKSINLNAYHWEIGTWIYANIVQMGMWRTLVVLHSVNNQMKKFI